jgi:antirestriction protein ArdC
MQPCKDIYQSVTNQVIAALEAGTPPWVCPWARSPASAVPANLATGRVYRGINTLLLNMQCMAKGYTLNRWLTFQQARALGGCVRKGETGTGVVFFKMLERDQAANDPAERRVIPLLRSFIVFNAAQMDGLPEALTALPSPNPGWTSILAAEALLERSGARIQHGGDRAFYRPADDTIQLPLQAAFAEASSYYATALHELTHWSGAQSRCNRVLSSRAHIEAYAFEELVAELGSAFLSAHCGLPGQTQHASYIASWLAALRDDKRLIFTAASLAQKAADFLLPAPELAPEAAEQAAQAVEVAA